MTSRDLNHSTESFPLADAHKGPMTIDQCARNACMTIGTVPGLEVDDDKQRAAKWVFEQLHEWCAMKPMGAPMSGTQQEEQMRRGLHAVANKAHNTAKNGQVCGLPVLAIIGLISSLFSIVRFIRQWLRGEI